MERNLVLPAEQPYQETDALEAEKPQPYLEAKLYIERLEQENNRCQDEKCTDRTLEPAESLEPSEHGISLTMYPVRVPSMHFPCATVQWEMQHTPTEDPSADSASMDELNCSDGACLDWTVNPLSIDTPSLGQDDIIDLKPGEETEQIHTYAELQQGSAVTVDNKINSCQTCDVEDNICMTPSNEKDQGPCKDSSQTLEECVENVSVKSQKVADGIESSFCIKNLEISITLEEEKLGCLIEPALDAGKKEEGTGLCSGDESENSSLNKNGMCLMVMAQYEEDQDFSYQSNTSGQQELEDGSVEPDLLFESDPTHSPSVADAPEPAEKQTNCLFDAKTLEATDSKRMDLKQDLEISQSEQLETTGTFSKLDMISNDATLKIEQLQHTETFQEMQRPVWEDKQGEPICEEQTETELAEHREDLECSAKMELPEAPKCLDELELSKQSKQQETSVDVSEKSGTFQYYTETEPSEQSDSSKETQSSEQFKQSECCIETDGSEQSKESECYIETDSSEQSKESECCIETDSSEQSKESECCIETDGSEQSKESECCIETDGSEQSKESECCIETDGSEQSKESECCIETDGSEQSKESECCIETDGSEQSKESECCIETDGSEQSKESECCIETDGSEQSKESECCIETDGSEQSKESECYIETEPLPVSNLGNHQQTDQLDQLDQAERQKHIEDKQRNEDEKQSEHGDQTDESLAENMHGAKEQLEGQMQESVTIVVPHENGSSEVVDREEARRLAERLYKLENIQRTDVVKHLDKDNEFSRAVGEEYLKFYDFTGQSLDEALRSFLKEVVLIGETQERERVLDRFSSRYQQCNPNLFSSPGCVLTLTCAVMLLNSDLHGQNVGKAMSLTEFVSNLDGMNEGDNFSKDLLKTLYNAIKNHPLEWAVEETELVKSMILEPDSDQDASLRSKSNPFQDLAHDKKATVFQKGFLKRKAHADIDGKRTPWGKRSWKTFYAVLKGMVLYLQKDEYRKDWQSSEEVLSVHHSLAERAEDYTKRPHVFRLQTADWRVFLFEAASTEQMNSWIGRVNLVSALYSSPPFPAAVGSQRKFCRPILPATQSALSLEKQLQSHAAMLQSFQEDLSALQQGAAESRKAKARELEEHRVREEYLQHERCRYEVYVQILELWQRLRKPSETAGGMDLTLFDQELWRGMATRDDDNDEVEGGMKRSHSSPSLELEVAPPPVVKVRRNISERRTYRKIVIPRRNKEL